MVRTGRTTEKVRFTNYDTFTFYPDIIDTSSRRTGGECMGMAIGARGPATPEPTPFHKLVLFTPGRRVKVTSHNNNIIFIRQYLNISPNVLYLRQPT
jgi:hypothetical protein